MVSKYFLCVFTLPLLVFFALQNFFKFDAVPFVSFCFWSLCYWYRIQEIIDKSRVTKFSSSVSSRSFKAFDLMVKCFILVDFLTLRMSTFSFICLWISCYSNDVEKTKTFLILMKSDLIIFLSWIIF